ncbi:toll/interleukin-1 receptor domain-containing protein [Longimicrobium terrae]|uniref:TIR domain-containing protein n=1 Tax=Longimicrobium terrae TaxID=1639882 RepID=A0A841GUA1_9BACT|nr:toll/interleukin-1 receptor domain-containing protein [Longimicrobium terrae]MBB4634202.1 hypothetical protein [Longimicrobium terrae]MBB6068908.1 hypothetical protein [Longimicrobium terrae]NNC28088.1 TIR domain-containing protein [Longimicrobium terrae]
MAEIFICYRRNDSEGYAGRLHENLESHFGSRAVFVDVDNLHPGVDFERVIASTLLKARVVLAVIGPRWVNSRLSNEADYVRMEVIAALKTRKRLIPVLVGGATMPAAERLPEELRALARNNAFTLRHEAWKDDVARLIKSLERTLSSGTPRAKTSVTPVAGPGRRPGKAAAAARKPAVKSTTSKDGTSKGTTVSGTAKAGRKKAKPADPPTAAASKTGSKTAAKRARTPQPVKPAGPKSTVRSKGGTPTGSRPPKGPGDKTSARRGVRTRKPAP